MATHIVTGGCPYQSTFPQSAETGFEWDENNAMWVPAEHGVTFEEPITEAVDAGSYRDEIELKPPRLGVDFFYENIVANARSMGWIDDCD